MGFIDSFVRLGHIVSDVQRIPLQTDVSSSVVILHNAVRLARFVLLGRVVPAVLQYFAFVIH